MKDGLPADRTVRRPTSGDVSAIVGLVAAYSTQIIGTADYTVDDARDDLTRPGFDPQRNAWLVDGPAGLEGFAWADRRGADIEQVDIDVVATDPAVARWLIGQCVDRAAEMGRAGGHPKVVLDQGVYRDDKALAAELKASGFEPATTFHRMRIDHDGPTPRPDPPDGVVLRECVDDGLRRAAHDVWVRAFREHYGHVATPYDVWFERHEARSTFDWSQLSVAEFHGLVSGILECSDQYVESDDCGYVAELGVLAEARGRGIAKFLLRHAFAVDSAAGRTGTMLHVDSNNTTPALGVYEAVAMRPVLVIDAWQRVLDLA